MAEIVGLVALSHSPFWDLSFDVEGPGETFVKGVVRAQKLVRDKRPDAFVIFGPDHFRNFFYDVLPPFCIGIDQVSGFGDYNFAKGPLKSSPALGRAIYDRVVNAGFDPALSLNMGVDHGVTQPYAAIDPAMTTPIVPIMVNASGAPRPALRRCYEFGQAVGAAIRDTDAVDRVIVLASGGLSHWIRPVSADDADIAPETRDYVINGRERAVEYSATRDASVLERRKSHVEGRVNAEWDQWFLSQVNAADLQPIFELGVQEMEQAAGNGSHEVRAWMAAIGAWGRPVETLAYEPVSRWVTGMGCIAGF